MQFFFEIIVQTASFVGGFWTIQKIIPKPTLLSLTILYFTPKFSFHWLYALIMSNLEVLRF